jgi:hypothetical protein
MTRFALALMISLSLSARDAEPGEPPWDKVAALTPGQTVRVLTAADRHEGVVVSVSDSGITLQDVTVRRNEIRRVYVRKPSHRARNAIIGTAVGVAVGAVIYGTLGTLFRNEGSDDTAYMMAMPIAIGAGVGAALPTGRMHRIYDARP